MGAIKPSAQAMIHKKHNELDTKDGRDIQKQTGPYSLKIFRNFFVKVVQFSIL